MKINTPKGAKIHKGKDGECTFYFDKHPDAAAVLYPLIMHEGHLYARLVHYQLGWAIQERKSGPYLGPDGFR